MDLNLFAPEDYWTLTPAQRNDICNGCGTKGLCGIIVPDTFYGLSVTPACDIHDFMYATGSTLQDKQRADQTFLNNMVRLIEAGTDGWFLKRLRGRRAIIYYRAVRDFRGPAFWSGKGA